MQDVLSSLPAPDSFQFNKARKNGHDTITLFLGNRPNPNGSTSQAWARIVSFSEGKDLRPPLLFYDQVFDGARTVQYPRSASSLLRKATKLFPPFCFLQYDPIDKEANVREMLSAIILYLAAATEVDASAWHWDNFGDSLIQALRYIDSRGAFHEWRHQQKLVAFTESNRVKASADVQKEMPSKSNVDQSSDSATEEPLTVSTTNNNQYLGGTVRSRGSDVTIRPNTSLERLQRELGDRKFKMLDKIPPKPMIISRHNVAGSLFPFRMLIGSAAYQETGEVINVYAYIDHEGGKTSMIFMSHDMANLEQIYDVNDMRDGVNLVQPLEYLNNLKKESYKDDAKSARTAKLRSLISYYFFIAENKGLIGNPRVDINEGFCKRLCAVCKELGMENWGGADNGDGEDDQDDHHDAPTERTTFQDTGQYLVVTKESNDEISSRLADGVSMDITKFRPNIVVSGAPAAHDEDYWAETVFPGGVKMKFGGTCWRCQAITVDYRTGKEAEDDSGLVWEKLAKDRRIDKVGNMDRCLGSIFTHP
ncbi:hypothetical protein E8E12_004956 [Didymella heteroderae]|uniref:MOSC domain-containing protein n=1 Tax=Didymella heteroderae TaxID=1769908 RepID=A0A9P4WJT6_9PLEO|nr:hypothetical protein E8E12_004956 [Didymella heteroderae]